MGAPLLPLCVVNFCRPCLAISFRVFFLLNFMAEWIVSYGTCDRDNARIACKVYTRIRQVDISQQPMFSLPPTVSCPPLSVVSNLIRSNENAAASNDDNAVAFGRVCTIYCKVFGFYWSLCPAFVWDYVLIFLVEAPSKE